MVLISYLNQGQNGMRIVEGIYPNAMEGSVWVSRAIELKKGHRVKINITGDFLYDISYWGAFELR